MLLQQIIIGFFNMPVLSVLLGLVLLCLAVHVVLEIHYFLRVLFCLICARACKKKKHILDETKITGICIPRDIDHLLTHMNNSRFVRELDFAKIDFFERTGLYENLKRDGGCLALAATTIRYRRFIKLFTRYTITTKIIYWDDRSIYMEHRFICPRDNFINAIVLCKTRMINCNVEQLMTDLIGNATDIEAAKKTKPEMSLELSKWIESNEASSASLRCTD